MVFGLTSKTCEKKKHKKTGIAKKKIDGCKIRVRQKTKMKKKTRGTNKIVVKCFMGPSV